MELARKYRPHSLDDIIGQDAIVRTLSNMVDRNLTRSAYVFFGPRGTGKTTTARIFAKMVGANEKDIVEVDGAATTTKAKTQKMIDKVKDSPEFGEKRVFIIDESHRLSKQSMSMWTDVVISCPEHVCIIFATTERDKMPDELTRHCLEFRFNLVEIKTICYRLYDIAQAERIQIDKNSIYEIAKRAGGSVRDAITLLDQVSLSAMNGVISADIVSGLMGTQSEPVILNLSEAIVRKDNHYAIWFLKQAVDQGVDLPDIIDSLVKYLGDILKANISGTSIINGTDNYKARIGSISQLANKDNIIRVIEDLSKAKSEFSDEFSLYTELETIVVGFGWDQNDQSSVSNQSTAASNQPVSFALTTSDIEKMVDNALQKYQTGVQAGEHKQDHLARAPLTGENPTKSKQDSSEINTTPQLFPEYESEGKVHFYDPIDDGSANQTKDEPQSQPIPLSIEIVKEHWGNIVQIAKMSPVPRLGTMLEHAEPYSLVGNRIMLSVRKELWRKMLMQPNYHKLLNGILRKYFKADIYASF